MVRLKRVFSFANVIACIALFVALGGSVYAAGRLSGGQIRKGSLPGNRIKPKSIAPNRIRPKSLTGRQVKAGSLTAKQIKQSTLTGVSAASLASVQYQATTVSLSEGHDGGVDATANCPAGTYVVGGGATVNDTRVANVAESGPNGLRNGWMATGFTWTFSKATTMTVTAICIAVANPTGASNAVSGPPAGPLYKPAG